MLLKSIMKAKFTNFDSIFINLNKTKQMKTFSLIFTLLFSIILNSQEVKNNNLPYYQIPDAPEKYTAGTVAARMVDGLGFRYHWATEGLRAEDLIYRPSEKGRTCGEAIDHILGLTNVIVNATTNTANDSSVKKAELSFEEKRKKTLENLKKASDILRASDDLTDFNLIFTSERGTSEFPFWNNINGPIADAIWHTGQVVLLRRASGNPFNSKVSVFNGKLRE